MSKTTTDLSTLKINYLSQEAYDAEKSSGTIEENEIYLTPASTCADYVVEQGSGYGGTYRKWNSGKCELWISVSANSGLTTSLWQSPIAYADYNYSTQWSGLFNAAPSVQASSSHNFIFAIIPTNITKNGLSIRFLTVTALSNSSYSYSLYVVGTWK